MNKADEVFDDVLAVISGDAAQRAEDQANRYADAMIRRDKEALNTGRPEHDLDLVGRILRAGH